MTFIARTAVAVVTFGLAFGSPSLATDSAVPALPPEIGSVPQTEYRVFGSEKQKEVVASALERYEAAGLELPPLDIRFHDDKEPCLGASGLAGGTHERRIAHICMPHDPLRVVLHELAHIWTDTHLDQATKDAFVELRGAKSWNVGGTWTERAAEHASEIIMWTLHEDEIILFASLGDTDPDNLTAAYEFLTGLQPPE